MNKKLYKVLRLAGVEKKIAREASLDEHKSAQVINSCLIRLRRIEKLLLLTLVGIALLIIW